MELREFVDNFDSSETIRIVQKEEGLYEGKIETLAKLLHCRVQRLSGKIVDGITQIEVIKYYTIRGGNK